MPLYEYECDNGHRFEVIQKFSDAPLETCKVCGAPVHKLLSSPAIQFKGSGWYITDYARAGKTDSGNVAAGKSGGGSAGESSSDKKTESKSDAAPAKSDAAPAASTKTGD